MKKLILYSILTFISVALIQACGPSQKEKQVQQRLKQNKMEQARQDSIAKAQAEMEARKREAQLEQAQTKKQEPKTPQEAKSQETKPENNTTQIQYIKGGDYAVQVGSWRSQDGAKKRLEKWKKRGYTHAYTVKYGNEDTGNVWFRVRLGVVKTKEMAKELQQDIKSQYNTQSWISYVGNEKNTQASK